MKDWVCRWSCDLPRDPSRPHEHAFDSPILPLRHSVDWLLFSQAADSAFGFGRQGQTRPSGGSPEPNRPRPTAPGPSSAPWPPSGHILLVTYHTL